MSDENPEFTPDEQRKRDGILRRLLKTPPEPRRKSERDKGEGKDDSGERCPPLPKTAATAVRCRPPRRGTGPRQFCCQPRDCFVIIA